jgi:hypothetical protein
MRVEFYISDSEPGSGIAFRVTLTSKEHEYVGGAIGRLRALVPPWAPPTETALLSHIFRCAVEDLDTWTRDSRAAELTKPGVE